MSDNNVLRFFLSISNDEALNRKLKDAINKLQDNSVSEDVKEKVFLEEIRPIGKEKGYDLTYNQFKEHKKSENGQEISDDNLAQVAAGTAAALFPVDNLVINCYKMTNTDDLKKYFEASRDCKDNNCPYWKYAENGPYEMNCTTCKEFSIRFW